MTAARTETRAGAAVRRPSTPRAELPRLSWAEEALPFRQHAGHRRGYDD